jgi:MFS transporter, DHA3 family, macrolide efflux protein
VARSDQQVSRNVRQRLRSSPYRPVLSHPVLRRVLPGFAVSAIGDGMALVAVTWMTLRLVHGQPGPWVGVALAAYTAPTAIGTLVFGRFLRGRDSLEVASWDAILRTVPARWPRSRWRTRPAC